jgi:MoaA/NifB/PqqE/SkfB family radical SAM enzyme
MDEENYRKIIVPLKEYLFQVFLYNWGEPFLNKHIYDIIAFNHSVNVGTVISSHFSLPVDAARLVESALDYLVISGDSHDPKTYETYRVGGKIETVLDNLDHLIEAKKRAGSAKPYIEWQCLVTRHNEHQLADIKRDMYRRGVNLVRFINLNFYSAENPKEAEKIWLPENPEYRQLAPQDGDRSRSERKPCFWLWRTAVVNADGGVTPCCLYDIPSWGSALEGSLLDVWSGEDYTEARLRSNSGSSRTRSLVCDRCEAPFIFK